MRNRQGGTGVYLDVADFDAARDELIAAGWAMEPRWTVPQDAAILQALGRTTGGRAAAGAKRQATVDRRAGRRRTGAWP